MNSFREAFHQKIKNAIRNNYGENNYDTYRFGPYKYYEPYKISIRQRIIWFIKDLTRYHPEYEQYLNMGDEFIKTYVTNIERYWKQLNTIDKRTVISLLVFRVFGYEKIKLERNNKAYKDAIIIAESLADDSDIYDPNFLHFKLKKFNLKSLGYNIQLYFSESRVAVDFIIEQYAYKINEQNIVAAEKNNTVLDVGGCWGDTALYFADKVGPSGKVFSFEFIPNNIKLFNINTEFNPHLKKRIQLINRPVSKFSGQEVYYEDQGPSSRVSFKPFETQTGISETISIDDFVNKNNISEIDFIKMDIEGAEQLALLGAQETIKKFRPKLAIAIYHNMDDFSKIPNLLTDFGYDIFIGHYTIHEEETICFGLPK